MENTETNQQKKSNLEQLGAIWVRKNPQGETRLSGYVEIDGVKTFVFLLVNKYKTNAKHPDYKIFKSDPNGQGAIKPVEVNSEVGGEVQYGDEVEAGQAELDNINPEDIPF